MENDIAALDVEFKRYLQLMRPYLGQLFSQDTIAISNAWIQRLSNCEDHEKILRNKYVFALCYQLARGMLEEPFLKCPEGGELPTLPDDVNSEDSSIEGEYTIVNTQEDSTEVIFNKGKPLLSDTEYQSQDNEYDKHENVHIQYFKRGRDVKPVAITYNGSANNRTLLCYASPKTSKSYTTYEVTEDDYKYRTNKLILKLREIKMENIMLQDELIALKEESKINSGIIDFFDDSLIKVDNATSVHCDFNTSTSTLRSLKFKLQEVQDSRNNLLQTIQRLQEQLDDFDEIKKHEIEDIYVNHKVEVFKIKSSIKDELKSFYEKKLEDQKQEYELKITEIQDNLNVEKQNMNANKDKLKEHIAIITEKDKFIVSKEEEIARLNGIIEEQKNSMQSVLSKFAEKSNDDLSSEPIRLKAEQLEKRLDKMEKAKIKCMRIYEAKLTNLQREKYLAECSLQLQLVRQRTQVINEIADENQSELVTALNKLENKYKEIVSNVQSIAIQRRVQDQMTLDFIVQAIVRSDELYANYPRDPNRSQLSGGTMQNQVREGNQSYDSDVSSLLLGNRVGNVIVGSQSFGEDSAVAGYCLDAERLGQLFERVYIPQRDTGDGPSKKQ